jgi:hypothetical protein
MAEKWIQKMGMKKGALRKELGVKEGKKIPAAKIEKATHSKNKLLAKRARLAETLTKLKKK